MTTKHYGFILILILSLGFINYGCDSATETKPVAITPPSLVAPPDNATGVPLSVTFQWTGTANKLEIGSNPTFSTIIHSANVSGGQYTMPSGILQNNTTYFWHAAQVAGSSVYWSAIFRFTTVAD